MNKRLNEKEKSDMERLIEFKLGQNATVLVDESASDDTFMDALMNVCVLNKIRDEISK